MPIQIPHGDEPARAAEVVVVDIGRGVEDSTVEIESEESQEGDAHEREWSEEESGTEKTEEKGAKENEEESEVEKEEESEEEKEEEKGNEGVQEERFPSRKERGPSHTVPMDSVSVSIPAVEEGAYERSENEVGGVIELGVHKRGGSDSGRLKGLSSKEALRRLLEVANSILEGTRYNAGSQKYLIEYIRRPESAFIFLAALLFLAFYIYGLFDSFPNNRPTYILVEAGILLAVFTLNGFLYQREKRLGLKELTDRADTIIEALERSGMNIAQDARIPFVPSLSVARVIRDGVIRTFPTNLLVEGDIVEMVYGDVALCRMRYAHVGHTELDATGNRTGYFLVTDQVFRPSLFGIPPKPSMLEEHAQNLGRYQFELLETPLEKSMCAALKEERPMTVIHNEARVLADLFLHRIVWIVLGIALLINLLKYVIKDYFINHNTDQGFEVLVILPIYAVLPLLPLSLPALWIIARSFGNAEVLVLFEALQVSKTDYEDGDDVDEFDELAPPPTKDVKLPRVAVWNRFWSLLTKWDRLSLTRSTNLFESLGSTTVICCIDREGTISNPFPSVEQILFPGSDNDITVLDVEEDLTCPSGIKFEDQDWREYLTSLKPLGLNVLLNTNCGVLRGHRRGTEHHRRQSPLHMHWKTQPARQTCLHGFGKEIGFTDLALKSYARRKEVYTLAPYHEILSQPMRNYQFEVPSMLSTIYEELNSGSYQLLSDGHIELILDMSSDYWDGNGLQAINDEIEQKIYDFYKNAVINDMQCIAFSYRPIGVEHNECIPFLDQTISRRDPGFALVVMPYLDDREVEEEEEKEESTDTETTQGDFKPRPRQLDLILEEVHEITFAANDVIEEEKQCGVYKNVIKNQIFLGVATLCHQPKVDVVDFVEDLGLAGIRFVYFSPTAERESKAYAERLGLETDWNSCILLSSADADDSSTGYIQSYDIKARLPRGIEKIRPHLEHVDDIPLHVSLFAECDAEATQQMIKIFQEYGEVVCCIGGALNAKNTASFALADISIAMEPMHTRAQSKGRLNLNGEQPPLAIGASLVSLPCGLFMQYETSLYALTQVIGEARRLLAGLRMGFAFMAGSFMAISLMFLLSFCLLLPPIFTGYQIFWVMWIICPILALSFLATPAEDNVMSSMPGKNVGKESIVLRDRWRFFGYAVARFILPVIMCLVVNILALVNFDTNLEFGIYGAKGWLHWTTAEEWAVLYAQNCTLLVLVWYLVCISSTFMNRTLSVREFLPFRNKVWVAAAFLSLVLQTVFATISLFTGHYSLQLLPWYVYVMGLLWPIVFLPVQEFVKMRDKKEYTRFQKRSKLEFNTKLGMHSPL